VYWHSRYLYPPFFTRTSLLPKSCPALPTADVSSHLYYLCALCFTSRSVQSGSPTPRPTLCLPTAFHVLHTTGFAFQCLYPHGTSRPVTSWYILHHYCFLTIQTEARIKATPPPTLTSASLHLSISALLLPCPLIFLCYKTCMYAC